MTAFDLTKTVPDEALAHVFAFIQAVDPPLRAAMHSEFRADLTPSDLDKPWFGWIRVSYVDRRWRQVALDEAALWSRLTDALGTRWLAELLRRSKAASLSVREKDFSSETSLQDLLHLLLPLYHQRFNHLFVPLWGTGRGIMGDLLSLPFDRIQYLKIESHTMRSDLISELRQTQYKFLGGHAPHLRRLIFSLPVISCMNIDWTSPATDNLTMLQLTVRSGLLLPQFLDALDRMKALRWLLLSEHQDADPHMPLVCHHRCSMSSQDVIHMNNLQCFILCCSFEAQAHLLRHVRLPEIARLSLFHGQSRRRSPPTPEAHQVYSTVLRAAWSSSFETTPLRAASLSFIDNPPIHSISLELTRNPSPSHARTGPAYAENPFSAQHYKLSMIFREAMRSDTLSHLPIENVRCLVLQNAYSMPVEWLASFLDLEVLAFGSDESNFSGGYRGVRWIRLLDSGSEALCQPAFLKNLRYIDLPDYSLHSILRLWGPGRLSEVSSRFPAFEDPYEMRLEMGLPPLSFCLHVAEEIIAVREGRLGATSLATVAMGIINESVEVLAKLKGVRVVPKDWNIHTHVPVSTKLYDA